MKEVKFYCDECKKEFEKAELHDIEIKLKYQPKRDLQYVHYVDKTFQVCPDCLKNKLKINVDKIPKGSSKEKHSWEKEQINKLLEFCDDLGLAFKEDIPR